MPFSNPVHRQAIRDWLLRNWPPRRHSRLIDIGTGAGAYGELLRGDYPNILGIEIFGRYVEDYALLGKYAQIVVADARTLGPETFTEAAVLMGDALEHLSVEDAKALIAKVQQCADLFIVVVPFMYEQGEDHPDVKRFGNPHEVHLQPDLTHEVFLDRYPGFMVLARDEQIGAYYWRRRL
jgi:hypothetical protein